MWKSLIILAVLLPLPAAAGTWTNLRWSSETSGNGVRVFSLTPGRSAYYNFTAETDSPLIVTNCGQIFTQVWEVTADIVLNIDACSIDGLQCNTLTNGSAIAADGIGPEGGTATAIKVDVTTCTTCEGEVEVKCGR